MAKTAQAKKGMQAFEQAIKPKAAQPAPSVKAVSTTAITRDGTKYRDEQAKRKAARATKECPETVQGYKAKAAIRILKDDGGAQFTNPHRDAGNGRKSAWDAMVKCATVADYWATGHKDKYLGRWVKSGLIRIGS